MKLQPLKQWYCDVCGEVISTPEEGYVIWRHDQNYLDHDFKIIHHMKCDGGSYPSSCSVNDFLGNDGLAHLLSFLSYGPIINNLGTKSKISAKDMDEFVDLIRRLQTPFYEEARKHFSSHELLEWFSDSNQYAPYLEETLSDIPNRFPA